MTEFAADSWARAVGALRVARHAVDHDPNSAASRAYYAAFHAVTALFALRDVWFKKHTALRAAVHRDLVHTGEWPKELGAAFDFLATERDKGDYGAGRGVTRENAERATMEAAAILRAVQQTEPELFTDDPDA